MMESDKEYFQDIYKDGKFVFSFNFSKTIPEDEQREMVAMFLKKINESK